MGRRAIAFVWAAFFLAAFVTAGCDSSSGQSTPSQTTVPSGLPEGVQQAPDDVKAFYQAPAQAPAGAKPGDLIWARSLSAPSGSEGFALLYWSTAMNGALVPVSAVLFRPTGQAGAPEGQQRAVLAWAHGTFGLGDSCAPTQGYFQGIGASIPVVEAAIREGMVFVATDYQGLGTPGPHPFMVNEAAGRNVLDSIRAAARFAGGGETQAVVMGQSQGGAATLFAAEEVAGYAPDVKLRGAVAIAPPSRMDVLDGQLSGGRYFGYVLMAIHGYAVAYPELAGDEAALTPVGQEALKKIPEQCAGETIQEFQNRTEAEFGTAAVLDSPDFAKRIQENDPGHTKTDVPIFIVHGEVDDTIPVSNSRELLRQYCSVGVTVSAQFYPQKGHLDVFGAALNEIVPFLKSRLAGTPASTNCG